MHRRLRMLPGIGALAILMAAYRCIASDSQNSDPDQIALGKKTAGVICQSCHLFPEPALLDKETWVKRALPYMEPWVGRKKVEFRSGAEENNVRQAGVFPENRVVSDEEWAAINAYFQSAAPAEPPGPTNKPAAKSGSKLFRPHRLDTSGLVPATTLALIDTNRHAIYVGDAQERTLKLVTVEGKTLRAINLPSAPVDVLRVGAELWVPLVGRTFPSDEWAGQLRRLRETGGGWDSSIILSGLPRLAHASIADLNHDGKRELILSGFGYRTGKLMLWEQQPTSEYLETVISPLPGAIATHIEDLDGDGKSDILLLRGQAREGVYAYYNRGDHFEEKPVIEFPPSFGTCRWQVLDFNRDGKTDLLICNGDAGDYPSKPRAYHGLRLYFGQGGGRFKEVWSYPLNGAYGACVADFDGDGDLDIAAIAFFPDYKNYPQQSFVYFENKGNLQFEAKVFPFANEGRWLVMSAADLDGDGDIDIALGSFANGPKTIFIPDELDAAWRTNRVSVLFLENTTR